MYVDGPLWNSFPLFNVMWEDQVISHRDAKLYLVVRKNGLFKAEAYAVM